MTAAAILPPALRAPDAAGRVVLTVRAGEVQPGDQLPGFGRRPVAVVTFDRGWWHYRDAAGDLIVSRGLGENVRVVRGGRLPDDTPPHGIVRLHRDALR